MPIGGGLSWLACLLLCGFSIHGASGWSMSVGFGLNGLGVGLMLSGLRTDCLRNLFVSTGFRRGRLGAFLLPAGVGIHWQHDRCIPVGFVLSCLGERFTSVCSEVAGPSFRVSSHES